MTSEGASHPHAMWPERIGLALAVATYLYVFQASAPNGDGRVYIRQVEAGLITWNPNHLLMSPAGVLWYGWLRALGLSISVFAALKLLSGICAVVSVLFMHATVTSQSVLVRVLGTLAVFFSAQFLSMAIAEEFFMLQMPVLLAALWLAARIVRGGAAEREPRYLAGLGILLSVATLISINNGLLAVVMGVVVAAGRPSRHGIRACLTVWIPGALCALPVLAGAYLASGTTQTPLAWLVAYQGNAEGGSAALYGITWTLRGVIVGAAKTVYGTVNSFVLLGQLGDVVESALTGRQLEFTVSPIPLASTLLLFAVMSVLVLAFLRWTIHMRGREHLVVLCTTWSAAYIVFNFVFSDISDQFWFQLLPPFWLMVTAFVTEGGRAPRGVLPGASRRWRVAALAVIVLLLAVVNTATVAAQRASPSAETSRAAFQRLLPGPGLLIVPGWDDLIWLVPAAEQRVERVLLMDLAMKEREGHGELSNLPQEIEARLARREHVIIARVFDRDSEGRPWEQLGKLGWSRSRLQTLLQDFELRPIGTVDGVVIREVVGRATREAR